MSWIGNDRARIRAVAPRKPSSGNQPDVNGPRPEEDERRMFEREFADVRPWRRGADRIPQVDLASPDLSGPSRPALPGRTSQPAAHALAVEAQADGAVGLAFGVSRETVAALRRGQFKFEARCDLHKLHADAARRRLHGFVLECVRRHLHAGLVICGRGLHSGPDGPILANVVTEALAHPPCSQHILAFTPAAAGQGGQGAVAVMFRRTASPAKF